MFGQDIAIDLGTASSDTLEIIISSDDIDLEKVLSNISFASLNIEKFKESNDAYLSNNSTLNFDNESIEVSIDNINSDKYIFIPYTYLNNMIATINDVDVEIVKTFDTFMMLELLDGENNITITYKPQLFSICAIVTVVSLIIFVVFSILNHKFKLSNKKGIVWIGFVGGCVILLAVGVLVYIKPFINFIVLLFS